MRFSSRLDTRSTEPVPPTPRAPLRPPILTPGMAPAVLVKWLGKPVVAPAPKRRPAWPKGDPPAPVMRSILKIKY